MALDPNIILQAGKNVTPLLSQNELVANRLEREAGQYKLNALRQGAEDDAAYRNVLRSGVTGDELPNKLLSAGLGKQAQEAQKFQTDQAKAKADQRKAEVETTGKITELMGGPLKFLSDNPSLDVADRVLTDLASRKLMSPEQVASAKQQLQADPSPDGIRKFAMMGYQAAIKADEQMKDATSRANNAATNATSVANNANTVNASRANNAATVAATTRGQNMGDERARELATIQRDTLAATKQAQAAEKGAVATDKKVTAFSTQLDKTNIPQFESLLGDIEADIAKFKDIPGYGGIMGNLPTFLQSEEGKALRQKIATLRNLTLKDRSGAAVTNQELSRLLEELGTGVFKTDADLTRGLSGVRKNLDSVKQNVVAGVDDATLNEYQARGGMTLRRGAAAKPDAGKPAAPDLTAMEAEMRRRGLLK